MLAPELVVADEEVAEALVVDASGQPVQGNIEAAVSDSWRTVGVMLLCRSTVSAETSVTFTLRPGVFDPIEVRFRKVREAGRVCVWGGGRLTHAAVTAMRRVQTGLLYQASAQVPGQR